MDVLHLLKGRIRIKLLGNTPERFLNICNANHIKIWNIEYQKGSYYFEMFPVDYRKLKSVVRKTSMRPLIIEKRGLPFILFRYRKHQCFVVGIMLSFFILYLLSLFVWEISFDGNLIYSDEVLMNYLEEIDVSHGILLKNVACDEIEKQFRRNFPDITWVSAEIQGTRLLIHIKENDEDVLFIPETNPCDIIAERDGTIYSIITRSGTPKVKAGDVVSEGDILVSGVVDTLDDYGTVIGSRMVHADADILINTAYYYEDDLSKRYDYKIYTGEHKQLYYVDVYGKVLHVGIVPEYDLSRIITTDNQITLSKNFYLPIRYGKKEYVEYYLESDYYTENQAKAILEKRLSVFLENLTQKGVQILENNVKIVKNAVSYSFVGEIIVIEPACTEAEPTGHMEGTSVDEYS